jgi:hypothetical protein
LQLENLAPQEHGFTTFSLKIRQCFWVARDGFELAHSVTVRSIASRTGMRAFNKRDSAVVTIHRSRREKQSQFFND